MAKQTERIEQTTLINGGRSQDAVVNQEPKTLNFKQYITENITSMITLKIVSHPYWFNSQKTYSFNDCEIV